MPENRIVRVNKIYNAQEGDSRQGHSDRWYIDSEVQMEDGSILFDRHVVPKDILEWRAAEYGIDPNDYDTLFDIIIAEPYIEADWYHSDQSLFFAPTIDEARENYLAKVAEVKLQMRISTRGPNHPLNFLKERAEHNPMSMAIKSMSVIMQRHVAGTELQPDPVVRTFNNYREAISMMFPDQPANPDPERAQKAVERGMFGANNGN